MSVPRDRAQEVTGLIEQQAEQNAEGARLLAQLPGGFVCVELSRGIGLAPSLEQLGK